MDRGQELQDIAQRRNDLLPEHQQMQKSRRSCKVCRTTRSSARRIWGSGLKKNGQLRSVIDKSHAQMEENCQQIHAESLVEAELDMDIRGLQAGDERRGTSASQSRAQPSFGSFFFFFDGNSTGTAANVSYEGGDENEKEQRKSAGREQGPPALGGRNEGFPAVLFFFMRRRWRRVRFT